MSRSPMSSAQAEFEMRQAGEFDLAVAMQNRARAIALGYIPAQLEPLSDSLETHNRECCFVGLTGLDWPVFGPSRLRA